MMSYVILVYPYYIVQQDWKWSKVRANLGYQSFILIISYVIPVYSYNKTGGNPT